MAETLAHHHGDPFDRMLIAQAMENKLRLVTANKVFEKYKVKVILNE
jgi:PIN domain nuclease of toxin-antitoxin system